MENIPERIQCDEDYSTDETESSEVHEFNDDDQFSELEMLQIEMTFSGGKKDTISVKWGDDPTDLARVSCVSFKFFA